VSPYLEGLPAATYLQDAVHRARHFRDRAGKPIGWFLTLGQPGEQIRQKTTWSSTDYACGVLLVYPVGDAEYEVLFWLRGAYRSLGLGRQCMEEPGLQLGLDAGARLQELHPNQTVSVRARYPASAASSADRLQQAMWLNFFHDADFRRVEVDPEDPFLVVRRTIRPEDPLRRLQALPQPPA
jgi:hypothetical protein